MNYKINVKILFQFPPQEFELDPRQIKGKLASTISELLKSALSTLLKWVKGNTKFQILDYFAL